MAIEDFINIIPNIGVVWNTVIFLSLIWLVILLVVVIIWVVTANKKKKGVDVSALAALAESDPMADNAAANANPKEVMAILSIERVAASTALSAVKDARKNKRISSQVNDSLIGRYQARIAKIDADTKRRSGAQDYQTLADSLEQSKDRLRGEVMTPVAQPARSSPGIPPPSSTPGIPSAAPPIPRPPTGPPKGGIPVPPVASTSGPPRMGTPPSKPSSPIPTPPRIPTVGPPASKPSTIIPPSVAPPTISTPPLPPRVPTTSSVAPPTTSDMAPPPVPLTASAPSTPAPPTEDSDGQSISGLRMEMLRELARLKKFMSDESQG